MKEKPHYPLRPADYLFLWVVRVKVEAIFACVASRKEREKLRKHGGKYDAAKF